MAAEKLVYKTDSVIATISHGRIAITVKGAVPTGGWKKPRLKLARSPDPKTVVVDFVAQPPPANAVVLQALLPVAASLTVPLRRKVVAVKVVADANEMTTQILK